ncbi:iron chelate uptake ABC transporter family permease subunit [endosymbiont 'TC1' of Trimyema compressum]|uniref:iron chelate uptake ABC transporter family permease subunit n=1 Tax=endosymbiont 'TC1' of Trimyema compressum TaxID=243899 RepID=UPI0024814744|nr:iron chelate uptake ABC transporter family permease subunit [endosymbiont 'TC1' of Trimyema compressum]
MSGNPSRCFALAAAGAAYQGLFKNHMVYPDILGVSSGASVGACLGILLSFSDLSIQILAFVFGLGAVF